MSFSPIELADVIRAFGDEYRNQFEAVMLPSHKRALDDIVACMTERMGGHQYRCADCDDSFWIYHGCRNRSCPKCHGRQTAKWLQSRNAEILPCDYFHVIATVPSELRAHCLKEQKYLYGLLMKTAAETLCVLSKDKHYIGAVPGVLAVLHTWSARMHLHPHIHMLVTQGGLSGNGREWHQAAPGFLVPVKKLSMCIRRKFAEVLKKERKDLFQAIPAGVWKKEWCTYCKPFGRGQEAVLKYLARYVFRTAITNARLLSMDKTHVTFKYKDNKTGQFKTERVKGSDFIRRFLLHVLPKGFHKVRYYGLWSPGKRKLMKTTGMLLQLTQVSKREDDLITIGDLANNILVSNVFDPHSATVKCRKCGSENVKHIRELKRGEKPMVT